jgi:hypothetical protein
MAAAVVRLTAAIVPMPPPAPVATDQIALAPTSARAEEQQRDAAFAIATGIPAINEQSLQDALKEAKVLVHGSRVTAVQLRTGCSNVEPDLATTGPETTAEGGVSDHSRLRRSAYVLRAR